MVGWMLFVVAIGYGICAGGLVSSVEKVTKWMMGLLFVIVGILAVHSITLPGAGEGLLFYLKPNLDGIRQHGLFTVIFAAMGQSFFTLSLGIGSMAVFGSYIGREKRLGGEAIIVTVLDTCAAIMAGLVIIPACFAFGINPGGGPGLIFVTLPNVFNHMAAGQFWGVLFFIFMIFAAMSTVIAVFENTIAFLMEIFSFSRIKSCVVNFFIVAVFSLPCALGFNLLSGFQPMGAGSVVLDLEDFILSNNLLPLGALTYVLFSVSSKGWGWDNFLSEANTGGGFIFPAKLKPYFVWGLPLLILGFYICGYLNMFVFS
jgi:NSS family neurotransmitter:Na+ symporter